MCNDYGNRVPYSAYLEAFSQLKIRLFAAGGPPNLEPRDDIWPTDVAPIIRSADGGAELIQLRWGFPPGRPKGPPVINMRSDLAPACSRSRFSGWISGWRGVLLIHWRWQPTGAGDLVFMDRRWPSDAEAAAGRPRPRAATLGHAAVRAQELLRVNHAWQQHACARRQFHTADFLIF